VAVLAHLVSAGGLPLPRWLLAYLLAFGALLVVVGQRASHPAALWPEAQRAPAVLGIARGRLTVVGEVVGALAYVATAVIGFAATDDGGYFASLLLVVVLWIGGLTAAFLVGNWFRFVNPFALVARLRARTEPDDLDEEAGPSWTAAAMVAAFLWFWLVHGERIPTNLDTALFLVVYAVAVVGGVVIFGARWLEGGEGFTATFDLVGSLSPIGRDAETGRLRLQAPLRGAVERGPVPGTAVLAAVLLGGVGFEGLVQTSWWTDSVVGTRTGTELHLVGTVGLAWTILIAYVVIAVSARAGAAVAQREIGELAERVGIAVAALALGAWVAYELPQLLVDGQNFVALASDPLGRGNDIFGTIDNQPDLALLSPRVQSWLEIVALSLGAAGAAVLATDAAFATFSPRRAARAAWPLAVGVAVAAGGAGWLLLGQ
jgi:hypothetical protein